MALSFQGEQVRQIGGTTLLVDYLDCGLPDGHCFGGAAVIAGDGAVMARRPLGQEGVLLAKLPLDLERRAW